MEGDYEAPIGNCYGTPLCREIDGEYYFVVEDWSGERCVKVSKKFYMAWCDEFKWCQVGD